MALVCILVLIMHLHQCYSFPLSPVLIVLGDSLVDVGNNIYLNSAIQSSFPPYGKDYFHRPTGRFSNGRNSVDFIAQYMGIPFPLPALNPSHNISIGVNLASGGSGILNTTRQSDRVMSLSAQLEFFRNLIAEHGLTNESFANTLFVISSGGNDLMEFMNDPSLNQSDYVQSMASGLRNSIQELYNLGARKVVMYGQWNIGCIPAVLTYLNACYPRGNDIALALNNTTLGVLNELKSTNPGLTTVFTTVYDLVSHVTLTKHNLYGFKHKEKACCGGGKYNGQVQCGTNNTRMSMHVCKRAKHYFYWDWVHPTEHAHEMLAKSAWEGDSSLVTPFNISTLLNKL